MVEAVVNGDVERRDVEKVDGYSLLLIDISQPVL